MLLESKIPVEIMTISNLNPFFRKKLKIYGMQINYIDKKKSVD